jgi:hypothetical protein
VTMSGSQWWPGITRSQWPGGVVMRSMRQSVAIKDMNTEAEGSAVLELLPSNA